MRRPEGARKFLGKSEGEKSWKEGGSGSFAKTPSPEKIAEQLGGDKQDKKEKKKMGG